MWRDSRLDLVSGLRSWKIILFGEFSLGRVLADCVSHFHAERNHQGKGNVILFPEPADRVDEFNGKIRTRERLDGLLKFYNREDS